MELSFWNICQITMQPNLGLLTDKVIVITYVGEEHHKSGQVETEHLALLQYFAAHDSQNAFNRVEPNIRTPL